MTTDTNTKNITLTRAEVEAATAALDSLRHRVADLEWEANRLRRIKLPPAEVDCVTGFTAWFGMPVEADMDMQTQLNWEAWQIAWNAGYCRRDSLDADARNRAMRLADAYAVMDIETEGIKAVGPSEWLITHDSLCDELTADSIEHLRYRRLALIDDTDGGLLVQLETDA